MGSQDPGEINKVVELSQKLAEVLEPLTGDNLERATIDAIRKHRILSERAEEAYHSWSNANETDSEKERLCQAYEDALLANRAQIALVAALTDKLGYIPAVDPSPNEP